MTEKNKMAPDSFTVLGLSNPLLKIIGELGFENPSDIQAESIPLLMKQDRDFIGLAQTGTGKTAAFGWPLLERVDPSKKHTQALILAPTRELGQQIAEQLNLFSKYLDKVNVLAVYGGASIQHQIKALRKPQHVIIATPGRLIDLIKRKEIKLSKVEFLVLDEADEMLNMGFKEEIDHILSYTPEEKSVWLFSATMPKEIRSIVDTYMDDPNEVRVNAKNVINANIEHQYTVVESKNKLEAMVRFMDLEPDMRGVIFCRTRQDTQSLAEQLMFRGYKCDAIHGDLSQAQRDRVMKRFKANELRMLVATDVAARGIDVNDLTHVFHHTLPDDIAYYTHRSGRTARAGKKGISISFIHPRDKRKIERIAHKLNVTIERIFIPSSSSIMRARLEKWCRNILDSKVKAIADEDFMEEVYILFNGMSKEELISKVLAHELEKLKVSTNKDLNAEESKSSDRGGRDRGRNRGRNRGRDRGKNRSRNGGKPKNRRSGSDFNPKKKRFKKR